MAATWSILEGGISNTFPLSINQSVDWLRLRRGECTNQLNVSHETDGLLVYSAKPPASSGFFVREFRDRATTSDAEFSTNPALIWRAWAYGRWWRISLATPYKLEYTDFGQQNATDFVTFGSDDFLDDGPDPITMIATSGDGTWFIMKPKAAYTLTNSNGDSASFRKSAAYYGMGAIYTSGVRMYSNAVIAGHVVASWNCGGDSPIRHYMWDGKNGSIELSRNVRLIAASQGVGSLCKINWAQNLVIANDLVYDLDNKRVLRYNDVQLASCTTRPYFQANFYRTTIYKFAFITSGDEGEFTATLECGQADDGLHFTESKKIKVDATNKTRVRHEWELEAPRVCRIFRLKIEGLTGTAIKQIDAFTEIGTNPNEYSGEV